MANFPVLAGIECLSIFADHDDAGQRAAKQCAQRWADGGRYARIVTPKIAGCDWNDALGAAA
jgi:putative DNA primase/helicase